MSKLEELINELCPNGVEYEELGEIVNINTPPKKLTSNEILNLGAYPVIDQGADFISGFTNNNEYLLPKGEYMVFGDHTETIKYIDFPFAQGADGIKILTSEKCNCRYIFHAFSCKYVKTGKYTRHWSIAKHTQIPLPPLPVQEEIVRILNTFTELKAELTAELTARKKQYEYYRDSLIYNKAFKHVMLSEIGTFTRGKRFVRTDIINEGVYCMHYGDIYTKYGLSTITTDTFLTEEKSSKMRFAEKNDVIIVQAGENEYDLGVGVVWESDKKVAVHDACYIYKTNQNSRYIAHYLRTHNYHQQLLKYVSSGKISSVNSDGIGKCIIPLPPLEEQQRIVDILDRFDTLCNDISQGLPAEIKARKQQYEYYRDKLLTFPNVKKEV